MSAVLSEIGRRIGTTYDPGNVLWQGAVGDGVANDYDAINNAVNSGSKRVYIPAGTYEIGTDQAIDVPSGVTIEGDGAATIISKTSGTADLFTTSGDKVTFRRFRMEGPNNTGCDGVVTEGGSRVLIEQLESYQLSTLATIGLTTNTDQVLIRDCYAESNTQQGYHFNKATNFEACGNRGTGIGTTNLHHGMYVGDCSKGKVHHNSFWNNAGSGVHGNPQGFDAEHITYHDNECWENGTAGSGERAGMLMNRDATATARHILLHHNRCWGNQAANILVSAVDLCTLDSNEVDADGVTSNGLQFTAPFASAMRVLVRDGRTRGHDSNVRLSAVAGATLTVDINGTEIIDASGLGDVGIFDSGAGTVNVGVGDDTIFFNNTTNTLHTASGGAITIRT